MKSLACAGLLALTGCLAISGPSRPAVVIRPTWAAVLPGDSTRLTAIGAAGDTLSGAPGLTWTSANPAIATIDSSGRVRARTLGFTIVTATLPPPGAQAIAGILVTPPVLLGAGDIASCNFKPEANTARLLDSIPGVVFTAGDNAYPDGTLEDFSICYEPAWGRHKNRTRPAPGNHEYHTLGAADYFSYFGPLAGDSGVGYYTYRLGAWQIYSLNSNVPMTPGSAQERWLREQLELLPAPCSLAYWHHPRFSSGPHGTSGASEPLWQALYDANADVVISGHDHTYERFAPQTPAGTLDPARGIREFVVGTGGAGLYEFSSIGPNSEFQNNTVHGVLKLRLRGDGYDWEFIAVGGTVIDSGSGTCH